MIGRTWKLLSIITSLTAVSCLLLLLQSERYIDFYLTNIDMVPTANSSDAESGWLTVLYWTTWNDDPTRNTTTGLREMGCPEYRCHFTKDRTKLEQADFVFVDAGSDNVEEMPSKKGHPRQHWVYNINEAPLLLMTDTTISHFFDWIQSYHTGDDVPGVNGYLVPLNRTSWPDGSNMMDPMSEVYLSYMKALNEGKSLHDLINTVPSENRERLGKLIETFESKTKLGAIMTSRCVVYSKRLLVIETLNRHLNNNTIDVYGKCTDRICRVRHATDPWCWQNMLAPNYFFYLSIENSLCEEYITEKLYNPLLHGLVPVVYGGANYNLYLPPHSFIDVQQHTPEQLADLLQRISEDKAEYFRYHLWRAFWEPVVGTNPCATCRALHRLNGTVPKAQEDITKKRLLQERCHIPNS